VHDNDYFEYFLWNLGYLGEEMFIMRKVGGHKIGLMLSMMLSMLTTKCMLGTKCKWNEHW
jgi:hypothetical protein